jgi:hypothetical protein
MLFDFDYFPLVALSLLAVTWVGLTIARILRARRDEAMNEAPNAWRFRSQLPIDLPNPFHRFEILFLVQIADVMEGTDEGFEVSYFTYWRRISSNSGIPVPAAIVQLPVEGPALVIGEGDPVPSHVGPRTAEFLQYLTAMYVTIVPFALLAYAAYEDTPAGDLQQKALQLAKAIVADAKYQSAT